MKKIMVLAAMLAVFMLSAPATYAAKPTCTTIQSGTLKDSAGNVINLGYDMWGYNYQAHMFNGFYGNYSRPDTPVTSGDLLMMKWNDAWLSNKDCNGDSKLDRPANYIGSGAWLTNHASGTYESQTNYTWDVSTNQLSLDIPWAGTTYSYAVTFTQSGNTLSGSLTDGYYPTTNTVTGTISGDSVTLVFTYPDGSIQGTRTYVGTIGSNGTVSGTWSETGSENATSTWSITGFATKVGASCQWDDFVKIVAAPTTADKLATPATIYGEGTWYTDNTHTTVLGPVLWGDFAVIQEVSSDPCGEMSGAITNFRSDVRSGLGHW